MTHDEIIHAIQYEKKSQKLRNSDIASMAGIGVRAVEWVVNGKNCGIYNFLDVVDALGLEVEIRRTR